MELNDIQENFKILRQEYSKNLQQMDIHLFFEFVQENRQLIIKLENFKENNKITEDNTALFNKLVMGLNQLLYLLESADIYFYTDKMSHRIIDAVIKNLKFQELINILKEGKLYNLALFGEELIYKLISLKVDSEINFKNKEKKITFALINDYDDLHERGGILNTNLMEMPVFEILNLLFKFTLKITDDQYFQIKAMVEAIRIGSVELVNLLITKGISANLIMNKEGDRIINWAIQLKKIQIVKRLIKLNADINYSNNNGLTPLHVAIQTQDARFIEKFLKIVNLNLLAVDKNGLKPIDYVKEITDSNLKIEIIKMFLRKTPLIDLKLILFSELKNAKNKEFVNFLLQNGANPMETFSENTLLTPAVVLIKDFNLKSATILEKNITNLQKIQQMQVLKKSTIEILEIIIKFGIRLTLKNEINFLLINEAIKSNCSKLIEVLFKNGANFKFIDSEKNNLLHRAIKLNKEKAAISLLKIGISSKQVNIYGESPEKLASEAKMMNLIQEMNKTGLRNILTKLINF